MEPRTPGGSGSPRWGANDRGQIGDGSHEPRPEPAALAGGHRFIGIAVGASHGCGLVAEGELRCWGSNLFGQLGSA